MRPSAYHVNNSLGESPNPQLTHREDYRILSARLQRHIERKVGDNAIVALHNGVTARLREEETLLLVGVTRLNAGVAAGLLSKTRKCDLGWWIV